MSDPVGQYEGVSEMIAEMMEQMQESTNQQIRQSKRTMITEMVTARQRRATQSVFNQLADNLMDIQSARNLRKELKMGALETASVPEWKSAEEVRAEAPEVSKGGGDPLIAKYQGLADNLGAIVAHLEGGGSVDDKMSEAGLEGFGTMTIRQFLEAQNINPNDLNEIKEAQQDAQAVADKIDEWMSSATDQSVEEFMDALWDRADNLDPDTVQEIMDAVEHYSEMKRIQGVIDEAIADGATSGFEIILYMTDTSKVAGGEEMLEYLAAHGIFLEGSADEVKNAIQAEVDSAKAHMDAVIEANMDDSYVGESSVSTQSAMQTASDELSAPDSSEEDEELDEILNDL